MKLDCSGLACPEPVLQTKKALEELPNDSVLEVTVSSLASKENVMRFAQNGGFDTRVQDVEGGKSLITIVKGFTCNVVGNTKDELFLDKNPVSQKR